MVYTIIIRNKNGREISRDYDLNKMFDESENIGDVLLDMKFTLDNNSN